jgi:hypothetical protein
LLGYVEEGLITTIPNEEDEEGSLGIFKETSEEACINFTK